MKTVDNSDLRVTFEDEQATDLLFRGEGDPKYFHEPFWATNSRDAVVEVLEEQLKNFDFRYGCLETWESDECVTAFVSEDKGATWREAHVSREFDGIETSFGVDLCGLDTGKA